MHKKIQRIHFVGIGGIGMSGIAEVLLSLGYEVSGSDLKESDITERLKDLGAKVTYEHHPRNVNGAHVIVVSSAIPPDNPELTSAREKMIPVIPRAEMLAELMQLKYGIAVSGTHGKTTATSMISSILIHSGLDPTVVIGGKVNSIGSSAKWGRGKFLVAEADESDGTFLKLSPTIAVVTSIDAEHLDYYRDISEIKEAFLQFMNKVPFYGAVVLCGDDQNIQHLIPGVKRRYISYGLTSHMDVQAKNIVYTGLTTRYRLTYQGKDIGDIELNIPGLHNVYNSLAAVAVGMELGLDVKSITSALRQFDGVQRRLEIKAEIGDITIIDDYGHHPTEIKAILNTVKTVWPDRRTVVVFQPHRYSRTKALFEDFTTAFYQADVVIISDIYPASEKPIEGVHASHLTDAIKSCGHKNVHYVGDKNKIASYLIEKILRPRDLVITLGAGNIWQVARTLIEDMTFGHMA